MSQDWQLPFSSLLDFTTIVGSQVAGALESCRTIHAGATEPPNKVPYMLWADTVNGWLKQRNAANSAWDCILALHQRQWITPTTSVPGLSATVNLPIWTPAAVSTARSLAIQSDTSTSGSSAGVTEWGFNVVNGTTSTAMLAANVVTSDAELAAGVPTILTLDPERSGMSADDYVYVRVVRTGSPTSLASARINFTLRAYTGSAAA